VDRDGSIPEVLIRYLKMRQALKAAGTDLVLSGGVPPRW
jgi:hypothetical protein